MKVISRVCVFLCCLSVALPALAQPSREHRRGEGARAEMRERREALREELRRQQSEPGRRDARREADGPALRRLNADEREQLRQQMREAARDGERPRRR
ncbi:MAG: hypothetical protein KA132_11780 [Thauera sp.]|nr:hypothetical protein [Thauera sp.]